MTGRLTDKNNSLSFNIAEFAVTSILAAKYVIALTWSQLQQTFVGTTYSIGAGQMLSGHKVGIFVTQYI